MRKLILNLVALLVFASGISAQAKTDNNQSKIEQFSANTGVLIEKSFFDIGVLNSVKVQVLVSTDLVSKAKVSGVRLSKDGYQIAVIDSDEIDAIIAAIGQIKNKVLPSSPETYTEVDFKSRTGFKVGVYFASGKWKVSSNLPGGLDYSEDLVSVTKHWDEFAGLLQAAKTKLH